MKVKSLLDELDEIREKREATGLQSDHVSSIQFNFIRKIQVATVCHKSMEKKVLVFYAK